MHTSTQEALTHFSIHDPIMTKLLEGVLAIDPTFGIPSPKTSDLYFESIVRSIVSQQISVKAAASIHARLETFCGGRVTPDILLRANSTELQQCGLSRQKVRYLTENAAIWHNVPIDTFAHIDDEHIITELTKLYGIGRWTAEMFLMFTLGRPDVFSRGDLGLMQGLYTHYKLRPHFTKKIATTIASWSPHRTTAALTLWRVKDTAPGVW